MRLELLVVALELGWLIIWKCLDAVMCIRVLFRAVLETLNMVFGF